MLSTITIQALYERQCLLAKDELILDVRTPEEYAAGHVPGARNITHTAVATHASELKKYKTVYVYCRSGGRVQTACHELMALGLNNLVAIASGGMPDWEAAGFPVAR